MITDSSVWIEYLRATGSHADRSLDGFIQEDADLLVPELVVMELTMGTSSEDAAARLVDLLSAFEVVPIAPYTDAPRAALLHRRCRRAGATVRSSIDCLIAATALRLDLPVLHRDRDFEVLARHSDLRTVSLLD